MFPNQWRKLCHKACAGISEKWLAIRLLTSTSCGDIFGFGLRGRHAVTREPIWLLEVHLREQFQ
jgi:hypothetical protein